MRTAGERTVFCAMAVIAAISVHATLAHAGQSAAAKMSFVVKPEADRTIIPPASGAGFAALDPAASEARLEGGFALSPAGTAGDARLLDGDRYYAGVGPVSWRSNAFTHQAEPGGPIDSVRVSVGGVARVAAVAPLVLVRPGAEAYEARDVDVTVTRGWPAAMQFGDGKYALDVTPHAGVGFGGSGGSAEAGATVRLGKAMKGQVQDALGLHDGDATFGDRGRWYIYAAASGRAVGFNMLRGQNGDWSRAGLTQDAASRLIGDSQAGVAWRRGPMQASLGYIHREIRAKDGIMGLATQKDDVVALSFSLKPRW
ncbi:lipid A-modifier LpxR family protein [Caulobacter sp. SSI4214]|uniref:lipid A-modifier LpxR family protein n=1 Tax=Caulobacter sp. SSI4214 TaxID=2575739 RepID=UPI001438F4A0|nr:lipid A-modifier LpxR family protein [Caulobacter sp. SSI4214]